MSTYLFISLIYLIYKHDIKWAKPTFPYILLIDYYINYTISFYLKLLLINTLDVDYDIDENDNWN